MLFGPDVTLIYLGRTPGQDAWPVLLHFGDETALAVSLAHDPAVWTFMSSGRQPQLMQLHGFQVRAKRKRRAYCKLAIREQTEKETEREREKERERERRERERERMSEKKKSWCEPETGPGYVSHFVQA